ncbi:succinate dehydrogenase, hydrophobic membrane anchor protein [Wolbachia endosymbiont of Armadillidium vulgare str. wVulC]|uniref:Succinate dehydrogenase hydrophobic membrane anchor subunit n=1 Tax=Wolbachia endosymbiont of Armadillidium arcangelii TaxID=3158571 RepID=A0AAU7Q4Z5_9RICK|nr:succinate dehydrogenase, hydrophobic membrane anchor protein [Wolbachia endosymbiont of Armadillidium vulgare]KLT22261.1 succinate dehydrogenase, hydrophobic membrane anchor protein [Wolbachia endosymbiont of Armadillidium vulgare str. wVulC]OJH30433.1 Succinate dehydrogenase hydrophobic membrane anchor subunit [Armadillidium vulgare] [Wolbachia endosymbiont of Armadillidium vulgare]OJH32167.1 Succinate dehydrogenase hydrophobic membrane anchor subunit [Wolbachia endosymbiont of Armadillidium
MSQSGNSVHHWWIQRVSAVILLFLFPWFIYSLSCTFYIDSSLSFSEKLFQAVNHPLELLFFVILVFCVFWHAVLGMQVVCEDYIYNIPLRIFTVMCIKCLSSITYITLAFTIFFFYRHIFL